MLVCLSGQSIILINTLEQNKQALFLENITFAKESFIKDYIDLLISDKNHAIDNQTTTKRIILGIDITLPCSIYDIASLIKKKLFLSPQYKIRNLIFKPTACSIFNIKNEIVLKLTEKESYLIEYLIKKGINGATEIELLNNIWHYSAQIQTSTVETHIYRLKNKLEAIDIKDLITYFNKSYFINIAFNNDPIYFRK